MIQKLITTVCVLAIVACQFSPKKSQSENTAVSTTDSVLDSIVKKSTVIPDSSIYSMETIFENHPIQDPEIFLGFKLGMEEKDYRAFVSKLSKDGKIVLAKNSNFTFEIEKSESTLSPIYGLVEYPTFNAEKKLVELSYRIIIKTDDILNKAVAKYRKEYDMSNENKQKLQEQMDVRLRQYQEVISNLFNKKYVG